ncbi:MAG: acyl-CoA dehydrogenase [Thiotrichaceae bacterium]|nr:acyl-CoA dehydrogenase [Thiotrichaceae bacterium]PCI13283.1 MAG: acyl-CoA dehydrogenase [Thiotrichales bacterium]
MLAWFAGFAVVVGTSAYQRIPLILSTLLVLIFLICWSTFFVPTGPSFYLVWSTFLLIVIPVNIPPLRQRLISHYILRAFRKALPSMSQTEREALEAGSVWWDGELFSGRPNWQRLLSFPAPRLSAEERAFLDGPVDDLCHMINDWQVTEELHDLPPEVWQFIKDKGFFGMIIPKKYGGLEFSALAHSAVVMKISSRSTTAAVTVMVPNSLGPAELLLHYGTDAQKDHYLPRLARGEEVPCFALTGPDAGSDASSMPDIGIVEKGMFDGKEVVGIRLNWAKRYITLGPVATVLGLAFKLQDPNQLLGDKEELGITLALIPTDTSGISIGTRHAPLNIMFQNGPNWGKDVFIPMEWVIGDKSGIGNGWRMLMESLAAGRSISLPALSTGGGKLACRATGGYARIRKQFRTPIGKFEGIEEALTRIAGNTYMMDAARTITASAVDLGEKPSVASAIVKYNLTERMRSVINDAMDIQGGAGICMGPRNLIGRIYQAIPISITVEGANILTRTLITFGQGAVRCHPYILKEIRAVRDSDTKRGAIDFDRAFFGHIGFTISNMVRAFYLGITGARFVRVPGDKRAKKYYQQLTRMSAAFALASDIAMLVLGGELKRKEKLSGRLADVLSHLYLGSAVLKRFEDQKCPDEDWPLLEWSCQESLYIIQNRLHELLANFPNRSAARCLRLLIFPLGKPYAGPDDRLGHKVAGIILEPSEARDRLTRGVFTTNDTNEAMGRIEDGLVKVILAEPVEKKIQQAQRKGELPTGMMDEAMLQTAIQHGTIDEKEAVLVRNATSARSEVIKVDDFPADYWK